MASRTTKTSAPVTFDLPIDLLNKIETCRKNLKLATASEVIRRALDRFDFPGCKPAVTPHRQISVRLSGEQRTTLKRFARVKDVSVGELLRLAIDALPVEKPAARKAAARDRR